MEERKVNIKPGNVKPTRSVRARSSSSFDNSVNTNIRKYTFINILFHRKIYKIVFIYDINIIDSKTRLFTIYLSQTYKLEKNFITV